MTREEAIKCVEFHADELEKRGYEDIHVRQALERLKEPMTLAEFLGWEEGIEYDVGVYNGGIHRVKDGRLEQSIGDGQWVNARLSLTPVTIENLRQAKKVEPKPKAYRGKDEYSYLTKSEMNKLGIDDSNAAFEEVEE